MRNSLRKFLCRIAVIALLPGVFFYECTGVKPVTESVRFAVFGNTSPDSPLTGFTKSLPELLNEIENRKPQIIIHTGNAVYGGTEADGILESDLRRQLNIFFPILKNLHTAVYTIPGEKDYYNGTTGLYLLYSERKSCYSFNYGSIHFIGLSSSESNESFIDDKQLEWLKNDLSESRDSNAVFVFAHHQLFPDKKKITISAKNEELHRLFIKYNVKAVFSGSSRDYSVKLKDSVKYINTGCSASSDKKDNKKGIRFYLINFIDNELRLEPVK